MIYVSGQPIPYGWRWWPGRGDGIRTQAAAAQDRQAVFRGSDHPARDTKQPQSSCEHSLRDARWPNTAELIAVHCSNPLCKPSFRDEDHGAATKNLDWLRTKVFRANCPQVGGA
jgi:hypothetical protein